MLDLARNYVTGIGEVLLVFAAFALLERLIPAERGQPLGAALFNVKYLLLYQFINVLLFVLVPFATGVVVLQLRQAFPQAFGLLRVDGYFASAWKTIAFFFVYDFFYYWFHRLQHEWGVLWSQHKLHHSELSLNVTTTFRHHWLEEPLRVLFIVIPMAIVVDLTPAEAGVWAFIVGLWPYFIHANLRLSLGPLTRVVAGPQAHRIHHSLEPHHLNRNYAAFFPLWDQLFGTFYLPARDEFPKTGLVTGEKVTTMARALWLPFADWLRR